MRGAGIRYKKLGALLRDARLRAGLTAADATAMIGLANQNFLYNAESGAVNFPASKLKRASAVYNLSTQAIIEAVVDDDVAGLSAFFKESK